MLLSRQQNYLLDVIRRLGCVRRDQLCAFAVRHLCVAGEPVGPARVDAMLRQLRCCTDIRIENDLVKLPQAIPDALLLEAVDVMLELSEGTILDFCAKQAKPILLRFSLDGAKIRLFAIVAAQGVLPQFARRKAERVVLLNQAQSPPIGGALPELHFIAVRQQDGTHRFFSGSDQ